MSVHTIIEIFDGVFLRNNIYASLIFQARKSVFFYEKKDFDKLEGVKQFLKEKLSQIQLEFIELDITKPQLVTDIIATTILNQVGDVIVEINGGNSIINNYARECCRQFNFPCVAIDNESLRIINVENARRFEGSISDIPLNFREMLLLYGRVFQRNMHMPVEEKYDKAILRMADFVFSHLSEMKSFHDFVQRRSMGSLSTQDSLVIVEKVEMVPHKVRVVLDQLLREGLIEGVQYKRKQLRIHCVAPFVKEIIAVKGNWLELYTYIRCKESHKFSEVYHSVIIRWEIEDKMRNNVENEIDVVVIKEGIPIFISCKMSTPKPEDLNEIASLTRYFGGAKAKAVLITSDDIEKRSRTTVYRAEEMEVQLIGARQMKGNELIAILDNL